MNIQIALQEKTDPDPTCQRSKKRHQPCQNERRQYVRYICKKNDIGANTDSSLYTNLTVVDEANVVFCDIHETTALLPESIYEYFFSTLDLNALSEYSTDEQTEILKNYHKLIVVINPMERLLLAYKKEYSIGMESWDGNIAGIEPSTFQDFLSRLDEGFDNEILETIDNLCHPCDIGYDFIFRAESLPHDINLLKACASIPGNNDQNFNTDEMMQAMSPYVKVMDPIAGPEVYQIENFIEKYYDDMSLFGYIIDIGPYGEIILSSIPESDCGSGL